MWRTPEIAEVGEWGRPPGLQPTPSSACLAGMELNSFATDGSRGTPRRSGGPPHSFGPILSLGNTKWHYGGVRAPRGAKPRG
jgi:hypothetical protein